MRSIAMPPLVSFIVVNWNGAGYPGEYLNSLLQLIGAVLPTTTLFTFGLMFLLFVKLHFSVKLSELSEQVKNLAHEIAILTIEKRSEEKRSV